MPGIPNNLLGHLGLLISLEKMISPPVDLVGVFKETSGVINLDNIGIRPVKLAFTVDSLVKSDPEIDLLLIIYIQDIIKVDKGVYNALIALIFIRETIAYSDRNGGRRYNKTSAGRISRYAENERKRKKR